MTGHGGVGWIVPSGLAVLLVLATIGEGGATPPALLVLHGLVAGLVLVAVAAPDAGRSGTIQRRPAAAFLVFLAAIVVSAALAPYAFAAHLVIVELAAFAAVAWLAARDPDRTWSAATLAISAAAATHGVWAVAERLLAGEPRAATSFLNPNHLAAWLTASLWVALARGLATGTTRAVRAGCFASAALAAAGIVATASRGALLGLAAGFVIWASLEGRHMPKRILIGAGTGLAAVLLLMGLAVRARFRLDDPFAFARLKIWRVVAEMTLAHPLAGTGPGQFGLAAPNWNFPVDDGPLRFARSFSTPHSDLLRAFVEFGVPAFALLAGALVATAFAVRRRFAGRPASEGEFGAVAALAALAAQSVVDDLTTRPAVWMLAALLVGVVASGPRAPTPVFSRRRPWRLAIAALVVLGFVVGDVAPYLAWAASTPLPRGRLTPDQAARLDRALSLNPMHPDLWLRLAEHRAPLDARSLSVDAYAAAREAAERAIRLSPRDARVRAGLARVEALGTRLIFRDVASRERTAARYAEAEERSVHDPFLAIEKGEFLLQTGDPDGARRAAGVGL